MKVLGISCFYHDAAAALLVDGELVAAVEEERFSRVKHDHEYPQRAIDFCLRRAGLTPRDLDLVVFYEKPFWKLDRILMSVLQTVPHSLSAFREGMLVWLLDKLWVRDILHERLGCDRKKIVFCPHHLSHACSAFYASGFEKAAVMTVDGVGEWATATRGTAWDTHVELQEKTSYPHSIGLLYSAFTAFLGFQVNEGEYKVMGLAPYGQPRFTDLIFERLVRLREDGSFALDMDYFAWHYSAYHSFNERFCKLFGRPRTAAESNLLDPHYADIAASIQKVTEEILVRQARHLQRRTGHTALAMAGGVALNSVANARVLNESGFERLYIQPAAGDGGGALGAALWGYHEVLGQPRRLTMRHCYWGQEHDDAAVAEFLRAEGCAFEEIGDDDRLLDQVVERMAHGQVVGWMQGRFEWGPRALGNRSILADPREATMKDVVNARIKFREPFRPFAPSVLADRVEDFFVLPDAEQVDPARFMLLVVPVIEAQRERLQAITHVDGTARIQAVHAAESPRYYKLIERFGQATGVPVVLNTSFNLRGEPIVNTPAEAYSTYARSDMDALVMGRFVVSRRQAGQGRLQPGADLEAWSHAPKRVDATAPPSPASPLPLAGHGLYGAQPAPAGPATRGWGTVRHVVGRVALILLGVLVGAEILLRLLVPMPNVQVGGMYAEDPAAGIHLRAGWHGRVHTGEFSTDIRIGAGGLREPQPVLRPERKHVLVLGDSFAFGCWSDADRTWLACLQRALGEGYQVINAGRPNCGTDVPLDTLRRRGDDFRPDVVVLAFYNGNDFVDNYLGQEAFRVDAGFLVMKDAPAAMLNGYNCMLATQTAVPPVVRRAALFGGVPPFVRHSYLYQFAAAMHYSMTTPPGMLRLNDPQAWFLKKYTPEMEEAVRKTYALLDQLRAEVARRHARLAIVDVPSAMEVYSSEWNAWTDAHADVADRFDRGRPSSLIGAWANRHGVPWLDLREAFRGRPRMYYQRDMHWNDVGHQQAGYAVARFLEWEGLTP